MVDDNPSIHSDFRKILCPRRSSDDETDEMEAILLEVYKPEADEATRKAQVAELAERLGRKPSSIVGKLSRMGVYVAMAVKKANAGESKADLVGEIANLMEVDSDVIGSLEKATKVTLVKVRDALKVEPETE